MTMQSHLDAAQIGSSARDLHDLPRHSALLSGRRSPGPDLGPVQCERSAGGHCGPLVGVLVDLAPRPPGGYIMPDLTRHMRHYESELPITLSGRFSAQGPLSSRDVG